MEKRSEAERSRSGERSQDLTDGTWALVALEMENKDTFQLYLEAVMTRC